MSYDLAVFDAEAAPLQRADFLDWYEARMEGDDGEEQDDPARATPALRSWFTEMIRKYPPMNGPLAPEALPEDDLLVSDYTVGPHLIYVAFAWSKAEQAHEDMKTLAARHRVGFFDVSSDAGEVWVPDGAGGLRLLHSEA